MNGRAITNEIHFVVFGTPRPRGSKQPSLIPKRGGGYVEKNGRPILVARDSSKHSKAWMEQISSAAGEKMAGREIIRGPVELSAVFRFCRPKSHFGTGRNCNKLKRSSPGYEWPHWHAYKPDLDKLLRAVADGLSGVVYADDSQVVKYGEVAKRWTTGPSMVNVVVRKIEAE